MAAAMPGRLTLLTRVRISSVDVGHSAQQERAVPKHRPPAATRSAQRRTRCARAARPCVPAHSAFCAALLCRMDTSS